MKSLSERLRESPTSNIMRDAADAIDSLEADVARLRTALQSMVEGDAEAIAEAEAAGIPFPEEMLTAYRSAVEVLANINGASHE